MAGEVWGGLPQLILAEVSAEIAVSSPTNIEVGRSLFSEVVVREHEQAERPEHASVGCTPAGAAVVGDVSLDHGLQRLFVDLELSLYVQLYDSGNSNNNSSPIQANKILVLVISTLVWYLSCTPDVEGERGSCADGDAAEIPEA